VASDVLSWRCVTTLRKYHEDIDDWRRRYGRRLGELRFGQECQPYETRVIEGNILVNAGIALLWDALMGTAITAFSNANARLGVGDSTTAAAATQTDLQAATNKLRKAMDATYPSRVAQTVTFKSTFGSTDANFAWQEWGVFNSASGATMLNRKVESLGTKTTGSWALSVDLALS
jgi:hypothetical protein